MIKKMVTALGLALEHVVEGIAHGIEPLRLRRLR